MQISVKITPKVSQYVETLELSQEKSTNKILAEKFRVEYNEKQQVIEEVDDILESTTFGAKKWSCFR